MLAPCEARRSAIDAPIPRLEPVTVLAVYIGLRVPFVGKGRGRDGMEGRERDFDSDSEISLREDVCQNVPMAGHPALQGFDTGAVRHFGGLPYTTCSG